jgi:hypothetical protein
MARRYIGEPGRALLGDWPEAGEKVVEKQVTVRVMSTALVIKRISEILLVEN